MKPALLILAAGMGSRYGGLKQIAPVGPNNEAIIDYSIYDAVRAGFGRIIFVVRENFADLFRDRFEQKLSDHVEIDYVFQELDSFIPSGLAVPGDRKKPWGTGHAVLAAKEAITTPFAVINADDFYGPESYSLIRNFLMKEASENDNSHGMIGYTLKNTLSEHGLVSRAVCSVDKRGFLESITEHTQINKSADRYFYLNDDGTAASLTGKEIVSMNIWGFNPSFFSHLESCFHQFIRENVSSQKNELLIPHVVEKLIKEDIIQLKVIKSKTQWFGLTYKEDIHNVINAINKLVAIGAYPEKLWN